MPRRPRRPRCLLRGPRRSAIPRTRRRAPTPTGAVPGRRARAGRSSSRRAPRPSREARRPRRSASPTLARRWRKSGLPAPRSISAATSSSVSRRSPAAATRERSCVVLRKRLEPQRQRRQRGVPVGGGEAVLAGTARRAREPRSCRKLRPEVAQELRRGVVHPVHVVEDEQRGRVEQMPEERPHHAVQARAPERRVEIVDLRRRLDLDVERSSEERRPGHELLVDLLQAARPRTVRLCSPPPLSSTSSSDRRNGRNG